MNFKIVESIKESISWVKLRIKHKIEHFSFSELKKSLLKGGLPLLIITLSWEIIEDILFPILFTALGRFVHPLFYAGVPASWLLCLHWLAIPVLWGVWLKYFSKKELSVKKDLCCDHDSNKS